MNVLRHCLSMKPARQFSHDIGDAEHTNTSRTLWRWLAAVQGKLGLIKKCEKSCPHVTKEEPLRYRVARMTWSTLGFRRRVPLILCRLAYLGYKKTLCSIAIRPALALANRPDGLAQHGFTQCAGRLSPFSWTFPSSSIEIVTHSHFRV